MGLINLGNRSHGEYQAWLQSPEGQRAAQAEDARVKAQGGPRYSNDGMVHPPAGWSSGNAQSSEPPKQSNAPNMSAYTPPAQKQPQGGHSAYAPGKAQPTQSPSQGTPYGQLPPTGSPATSYADAWNAAMPKGGDGVTFTPARSVIGAGAGNMAYAQPGQRPEGFSTQSYDLQGNPVTQGQHAQQRDAFVSQILQAPRDTPQHDFQGMLGKANDMVKDGWQNPFNFNQQQGTSQTAQPPSPGGQPSSPGVQGRPDNRMAIQDLFTQNNIQAPQGFIDQLIARLGGGEGGGGGERGSAQGYGGEQATPRGPEQPQWSQKPVHLAPPRGGIWEGPPSSHGQPSQPIAPQQPPAGNDPGMPKAPGSASGPGRAQPIAPATQGDPPAVGDLTKLPFYKSLMVGDTVRMNARGQYNVFDSAGRSVQTYGNASQGNKLIGQAGGGRTGNTMWGATPQGAAEQAAKLKQLREQERLRDEKFQTESAPKIARLNELRDKQFAWARSGPHDGRGLVKDSRGKYNTPWSDEYKSLMSWASPLARSGEGLTSSQKSAISWLTTTHAQMVTGLPSVKYDKWGRIVGRERQGH